MGTKYIVCEMHLQAMICAHALNAENGAITVKIVENPNATALCDYVIGRQSMTITSSVVTGGPVYCSNLARFELSYHPKRTGIIGPNEFDGVKLD